MSFCATCATRMSSILRIGMRYMSRKPTLTPSYKQMAEFSVTDMYRSARRGAPVDMVEDSDGRPAGAVEIEETLRHVYIPPEFRRYFEEELEAATFPRGERPPRPPKPTRAKDTTAAQVTLENAQGATTACTTDKASPQPKAERPTRDLSASDERTIESLLEEVGEETKPSLATEVPQQPKERVIPTFQVGKFREDDRRKEQLPDQLGETIHRLLNYLLTPAATKHALAQTCHPYLQSSNMMIESVNVSRGARKAVVHYSVYDKAKQDKVRQYLAKRGDKVRHYVLTAMPSSRERRARVPDLFEFRMKEEEPIEGQAVPKTSNALSHVWQRMQDEINAYDAAGDAPVQPRRSRRKRHEEDE